MANIITKVKNYFKNKRLEGEYMMNMQNDIRKLSNLVKTGYDLTNEEYILHEIKKFKLSQKRKLMIIGENYYEGKHDILNTDREVINADGELEKVDNLPNNHVIDNQYKKMVDQKANYLLGKPFSFKTENKTYSNEIKKIFNKKFKRTLRGIGIDSINEGTGWLYVYYDEDGKLSFKVIKNYELIPIWHDSEHTILDSAIRLYETIKIKNKKEEIVENVEVYTKEGIYYFILDGNRLVTNEIKFSNYFTVIEKGGKEQIGYNWNKIPLIPFKYNPKEIPLIKMVKSLQDGINQILSTFENNMEEDIRNTIFVLVNFDGENLGEFRHNLATYGSVKISNTQDMPGDLKTLQVEVNSENYKAILEIFKKALIENAMGYDAKDDRLQGNPNQLNIRSMYSDIDLDANGMETEFQASFEDLLWFINCYLSQNDKGNFENEDVEIIFDRDILINETEVINNCNNSMDILSEETIVANHPWISDPQKELESKEKERKKEIDHQYSDAFNPPKKDGNVNEE